MANEEMVGGQTEALHIMITFFLLAPVPLRKRNQAIHSAGLHSSLHPECPLLV